MTCWHSSLPCLPLVCPLQLPWVSESSETAEACSILTDYSIAEVQLRSPRLGRRTLTSSSGKQGSFTQRQALVLCTKILCQINWITQLFFLLSTCSIKVSILLFYRRLPPGTHTWLFSCAVLAAIAVIVAYPVAFLLILIFQCQPLDSYWMRFAPDYNGVYQCRTKEAISLPISAYLSTIIDFLVLLLPLWQVQNIKLPRRQKWTLYAIFSLGLV